MNGKQLIILGISLILLPILRFEGFWVALCVLGVILVLWGIVQAAFGVSYEDA